MANLFKVPNREQVIQYLTTPRTGEDTGFGLPFQDFPMHPFAGNIFYIGYNSNPFYIWDNFFSPWINDGRSASGRYLNPITTGLNNHLVEINRVRAFDIVHPHLTHLNSLIVETVNHYFIDTYGREFWGPYFYPFHVGKEQLGMLFDIWDSFKEAFYGNVKVFASGTNKDTGINHTEYAIDTDQQIIYVNISGNKITRVRISANHNILSLALFQELYKLIPEGEVSYHYSSLFFDCNVPFSIEFIQKFISILSGEY